MPMTTLTILQLTQIFCAYLFVSVGLPAFVLGRRLSRRRAAERFLIYFIIGNFFIMNLVFTLQLLKISYPITLTLGTLLFAVAGGCMVNGVYLLRSLKELLRYFRRLIRGRMGYRIAVYRLSRRFKDRLGRFGRWLGRLLVFHFFDCVLVAFFLLMMWRIYGVDLLNYYGYKASDMVVHNYWVNSMNHNRIFVAGVYPHGFHCVLYYLHAVFGIKTFVLFRLFAFVQNVMMNLTMLCVLRLCCKSRYTAYAGTILFVMGDYFNRYTYSRYYATLPQEFGIIFILPAIYFLFAFLEARRGELAAQSISKREIDIAGRPEGMRLSFRACWHMLKERFLKGKEGHSDSWICLAIFCMSFSMTLAVHFYGTMVAFLFCLGVAAGYCLVIFRKKYFWSVMITGLLSVMIAVLPMLLAFLGGTRLEGSLRWGMSVFLGSSNEEEETSATESIELSEDVEVPEDIVAEEVYTDIYGGQKTTVTQDIDGNVVVYLSVSQVQEPDTFSFGELIRQIPVRVGGFGKMVWSTFCTRLNVGIFSLPDIVYSQYIMDIFLALIGLGFFYQIFRRQYCYGAMLASTGFYILFMCVIMDPRIFGLPYLMDSIRSGIYFAYSVPVGLTLFVDGVLYLPFFSLRNKAARFGGYVLNFLSLAFVCLAVYYTVDTGQVKAPLVYSAVESPSVQEMNEAIVCLTNIIETEEDFTWTIVSANDELRMGEDHGWHYETFTFLEDMERLNADTLVRIPTQVVYFYVEKIPMDYNSFIGGISVSEEGAAQILPARSGIDMYKGRDRWILMSRMYYWAQKFKESYPGEMEVYLETDRFVCYRLEQNPYRLYNLAIDYGYNNRYFG